jgi:hypothetical protein
MDSEVLIVGAGPVGLTLAIDLGKRGVRGILIEQKAQPVLVLDVPDRIARDIYGYDLLLLRPDMHVVWRGNTAPEEAAEIAAIATGRSDPA